MADTLEAVGVPAAVAGLVVIVWKREVVAKNAVGYGLLGLLGVFFVFGTFD